MGTPLNLDKMPGTDVSQLSGVDCILNEPHNSPDLTILTTVLCKMVKSGELGITERDRSYKCTINVYSIDPKKLLVELEDLYGSSFYRLWLLNSRHFSEYTVYSIRMSRFCYIHTMMKSVNSKVDILTHISDLVLN